MSFFGSCDCKGKGTCRACRNAAARRIQHEAAQKSAAQIAKDKAKRKSGW